MKRIDIPPDVTWRYVIQKPGDKPGFRVYRREASGKMQAVRHEALTGVNKRLKEGVLLEVDARKEVELLVERLYKADGAKVLKVVSNSDNRRIFEEFWEDEYGDRFTKDKDTMRWDFLRALDAIGELSIQVATAKELNRTLKDFPARKHARIVARLHTILDWLGRKREVKLRAKPKEHIQPAFIQEEQLPLILAQLALEDKIGAQFAFYSGLRLGEQFAIAKFKQRGARRFWIDQQLYPDGSYGPPKNKKPRFLNVYQKAMDVFEPWLAIRDQLVSSGRMPAWRSKAAERISNAARKAGLQPLRWHDLRHSYAVKLLEDGAGIQDVADMLGNTIKVTEEHYVGFLRTDKRLDALEQIMKLAEAKQEPIKGEEKP